VFIRYTTGGKQVFVLIGLQIIRAINGLPDFTLLLDLIT